MQGLFRSEQKESQSDRRRSASSKRFTGVLGFIGSAIIWWIILRVLAPILAAAWGFVLLTNVWVRIAITAIVALAMAALLIRLEDTIWGRYYVIIGYLFSLGLIVWIVLRLLGVI